jgi:BirA family biotin operon repressor/biotin-[acetyl-CoA-carboxylase] ligase
MGLALEAGQIKYKVLDILSDAQFHSGESLGQALGVSRTAVWKQLQKLESMGLQLESVKGKGYRVSQGFELLQDKKIIAHLSTTAKTQLQALQLHQSLDSTNKVAADEIMHRQSAQDSASGTVILSEYQTMGRGRRGKRWVSPFACNIYLSIIWDFDSGANALQGLSLAIGVAVRRALTQIGVEQVQLKWPNDIYINQKKLGGILLEMVGDPAGQCTVIIGIGINVTMPDKSAQSIDQQWTDLKSCAGKSVSRNQLAALIIENCFNLLADYEVQGFTAYRDEWQANDAFQGKQGIIITPKQSIAGTVRGVDNVGALQMELKNGEINSFVGGELSLRLGVD